MGKWVTKIIGMLPNDDDNDGDIPEIQEQCNRDICDGREMSEDDFEGSIESEDEPDVREETYKYIFDTREDNDVQVVEKINKANIENNCMAITRKSRSLPAHLKPLKNYKL